MGTAPEAGATYLKVPISAGSAKVLSGEEINALDAHPLKPSLIAGLLDFALGGVWDRIYSPYIAGFDAEQKPDVFASPK